VIRDASSIGVDHRHVAGGLTHVGASTVRRQGDEPRRGLDLDPIPIGNGQGRVFDFPDARLRNTNTLEWSPPLEVGLEAGRQAVEILSIGRDSGAACRPGGA
jgi:hypothetical protein